MLCRIPENTETMSQYDCTENVGVYTHLRRILAVHGQHPYKYAVEGAHHELRCD